MTPAEMLSRANDRLSDGRTHPYGSQHAAAAFGEAAALANIATAMALVELVGLVELGQALTMETIVQHKAEPVLSPPPSTPVVEDVEWGNLAWDIIPPAVDHDQPQPDDFFAEAKAIKDARTKRRP